MLKYAEKDEGHRGEYKKKENKVMMIDSSGKAVGTLFELLLKPLAPSFGKRYTKSAFSGVKDEQDSLNRRGC